MDLQYSVVQIFSYVFLCVKVISVSVPFLILVVNLLDIPFCNCLQLYLISMVLWSYNVIEKKCLFRSEVYESSHVPSPTNYIPTSNDTMSLSNHFCCSE